jgi:hypothetical protein
MSKSHDTKFKMAVISQFLSRNKKQSWVFAVQYIYILYDSLLQQYFYY